MEYGMTTKGQREKDLDIEVTPVIEDAFYFVKAMEAGIPDIPEDATPEEYEKLLSTMTDAGLHAGERLCEIPKEEADKALQCAYQMLHNLREYGIPSSRWP